MTATGRLWQQLTERGRPQAAEHSAALPGPVMDDKATGGQQTVSAMTHLFAGVPVSDLELSIDWYTRFFGRPPDMRVGNEVLWEIDERAWLFIEPGPARAGGGRITLEVAGLDAHLERFAAERIEHEPIETYSNGVRHVKVPDPDDNSIALAEPPACASTGSTPTSWPAAVI